MTIRPSCRRLVGVVVFPSELAILVVVPDGDQTHRGLLHRSVWTWTRSKIIGVNNHGIVCSHILFGRVSFGGHSLVGTWRTCETTAARLGHAREVRAGDTDPCTSK